MTRSVPQSAAGSSTIRDILGRSFGPIYGHPCWGLNHEPTLNLSMSFGRPSLRVREPYPSKSASEAVRRSAARRLVTVRGRWWLWLWGCRWRLSSDGKVIAKSDSSRRKIDAAIRELAGQKLISAGVGPGDGESRFGFDLGGVLECRPFRGGRDWGLWHLYEPSGRVLTYHGDGTFLRKKGADSDRTETPEPAGSD